MIIRNVLELQSSDGGPYTMVLLDTPETIHPEDDSEELIPGVVYVPVSAVIYFVDKTTINVEI